MISRLKQHYHWLIALVMLIELAIIGGFLNNYTSLYVIPITEELGIRRADFSLAVSVRALVGFVCTAFSSALFMRFGTKKPILAGMALIAIAFGLLSSSKTVAFIGIASAIAGAAEALCSTAAASRVISDWFNRFQGTVLGIVTAATGIGGSIMCTLLSGIIERSGWRFSYLVAAAIVLITAFLVLLFVRSRPEEMGLRPYGMDYTPEKKKHHREDAHWLGYTTAELFRMPVFYLTAVVLFLAAICMYLAFSMIVPHLQDQGMSASDAAALNSMLLIFLAVFKCLYGSLCDLIGPKAVCVICMVFGAVGLWLMADITGFADALIAILIYAMGLPVVTVLIPLLTYPLFGYRSHSATLGIFMAMPMLGSLIATPISNAVYDRVGSYTPVFQFAAVLSLVVVGMYLLLFWLTQREQKRYMAAN